jgi:hypothetical protein
VSFLPVKWEGHLVGTMTEPRFENWNVHGGWAPEDSASTTAFIDALKHGRELSVTMAMFKGYVTEVPTQTIVVNLHSSSGRAS